MLPGWRRRPGSPKLPDEGCFRHNQWLGSVSDSHMNRFAINQVIIYHDETKDVPGRNLKGHILLLVPRRRVSVSNTPLFGKDVVEYSPQRELFQKIEEVRQEFACDGKFHFSEVSGRKWTKYDLAYMRTVEIGVDGLRHKFQEHFLYPLNCKMAVMFYRKLADWSVYGGDSRKEQRLRHDETILRMLLKGAAHYLYDESSMIEVVDIICDGEPEHRPLDEERVVWRLTYDDQYGRVPLRDYVTFSRGASVVHLPSDHKCYEPGSDECIHANLLQMADLLLGSVMRSCYVDITQRASLPRVGEQCTGKRDIIAQPVKEMLGKASRGAGFKNSGHYKSFTINQVDFAGDGISFRRVQPTQVTVEESGALQMRFMFS